VTGPSGADSAPPLVTPSPLAWEWGDAYAFGYRDDQWIAARRDGRGVLVADTLAGLEAAIEADYRTGHSASPPSRVRTPRGGLRPGSSGRARTARQVYSATNGSQIPAPTMSRKNAERWTTPAGRRYVTRPRD
jgi:hypothetical protein